jgi:hypothetical protein
MFNLNNAFYKKINVDDEFKTIFYKVLQNSEIKTPLSILPRVVSLEIINQTTKDKEVSDPDFITIVRDSIENMKQDEIKYKGLLDISQIKL